MSSPDNAPWHRRLLEGRATLFAVLTTVTMSIGGLVEIAPMFSHQAGPQKLDGIQPYTPLEVAGRDIYVREGCYLCHSQMVRPMRAETLRFGGAMGDDGWSHAGEYEWDRPFLLGSRRIGPDLMREGGKYPDSWHYEHMMDPRSTSPGSIMPTYAWLYDQKVDPDDVRASLVALRRVGTPYTDDQIDHVADALHQQADGVVERLAKANVQADRDTEIIALIAYLQRLGTDGKAVIAHNASQGDGSADAADAGGGQ